MYITLDDVSYLLHLPMTSKLINDVLSTFDRVMMKILLMTRLGIPTEEETIEATIAGARVKLTWLAELHQWNVALGSCMWAATTYLLPLVDSMILADKSSTHIHVAYLLYLNNLDACHDYAWGVTTLSYLYNLLSSTSQ
ncbi:Protein MAINTENANCE OF MERISTEMS [Glycine max]|uniref:uncharacterized protein n=1 Tax=Glycine max TaxID=3847 RepID=UPI000719343A|nr:uncharacterized protein LOC106799021 [Glycine max]XP_028184734.1 uncharacterized protein LOC114371518 [Glycine soja]KAH1228508.1 Protein MAINTENANCE OF MERISTEMS [Glycine max]|eukprot:XP_014632454.1 uncharacterized protein LOC106799021 [Glycine max]